MTRVYSVIPTNIDSVTSYWQTSMTSWLTGLRVPACNKQNLKFDKPIHWSQWCWCRDSGTAGAFWSHFRRRDVGSGRGSFCHRWIGRVVTIIGPVERLLQLRVHFDGVDHCHSGRIHAWTDCIQHHHNHNCNVAIIPRYNVPYRRRNRFQNT